MGCVECSMENCRLKHGVLHLQHRVQQTKAPCLLAAARDHCCHQAAQLPNLLPAAVLCSCDPCQCGAAGTALKGSEQTLGTGGKQEDSQSQVTVSSSCACTHVRCACKVNDCRLPAALHMWTLPTDHTEVHSARSSKKVKSYRSCHQYSTCRIRNGTSLVLPSSSKV